MRISLNSCDGCVGGDVQVRLSGKRKEPDDPASLVAHNASMKAVRRKSGDSKSSVIPQRDGADDRPTPTPQHSEQEGMSHISHTKFSLFLSQNLTSTMTPLYRTVTMRRKQWNRPTV